MKQKYLWAMASVLTLIYLCLQVHLLDTDVLAIQTVTLIFSIEVASTVLPIAFFSLLVTILVAIPLFREKSYKSRFVKLLPVSIIAILTILILSKLICRDVEGEGQTIKPPLSNL